MSPDGPKIQRPPRIRAYGDRVGAERLARGVAAATLSAPLLLLTQLLTGAAGPSPRAMLAALLAVAATAAALDGPGTLRTALATGTAQLAGYAVLATAGPGTGDGCLPAVGRGAGILLGLDVPADRCVAAGPLTLVGGAVTCVMVAVGILLGHALLAGLGGRLLTLTGAAALVAVTVARAAGRVAVRLLPALPGPVTGGGDRRARPVPVQVVLPLRPDGHAARRTARRGPPVTPAPLPA